jgi:hypothetical protein
MPVRQVVDHYNRLYSVQVLVPRNIATRKLTGGWPDDQGPEILIAELRRVYGLRACPNVPDEHSVTMTKGKCPTEKH